MTTEKKESDKKREQVAFERVVFFSDAVFAIAITLLALEVRLPFSAENLNNIELKTALLTIWPKYLGFITSFLVIGFFWIGHHRKFQYIHRFDVKLLVLNLLFLMVIAFIPFPTSILSEYGNKTATIFYASTMIFAGILSSLFWFYASYKSRFIDPMVSNNQRRRIIWGPLFMVGIFLLSIGIAMINDDVAKISWVLILFVNFISG